MTKKEFYNIQLNDAIIEKKTGRCGSVSVLSRGEVYVDYGDGYLYCYDISEDRHCYREIKKYKKNTICLKIKNWIKNIWR